MKQQQVAPHFFGPASTLCPRATDRRRKRGLAGLLAGVSASAAALALSFAPQPARAQAVNGTPNVVFGADAPIRSATQDSFNVTASEALIDWTVTDPAVFLNAATTLSYNGSSSGYTVLNRVVSSPSLSSTLALNGRVQSNSAGKIWFYNPGGWAVGAGAVIDVGSLLLTAANPTIDPFDPADPGASRFLGPNGEIRLTPPVIGGGGSVAGASITVDPLANIISRGDNSYIALVAPRVVQAGTVNGGGSVAYVGAEAADITINNGLFDIAVTSGTTDPNGIVHTGTTTGPGSFTSLPRTQFLVAVGKNDAMTMLVRGQLGYNAASSAGFVNGRIVLSAGQGIVANNPAALGARPAGVAIGATTFRNDLTVAASDAINIAVGSAAQNVRVNGDATLQAARTVGVAVSGSNAQFSVQGDLLMSASNGANGGAVTIALSNGGQLAADRLIASADGFGAQQVDQETGELISGAIGENARGGTVTLTATGATLQVSSETTFSADARGGIGGASAGSSTAGSINVTTNGSLVRFGEGGVELNARGLNANGGRTFLTGATGSASRGGNISLDLTGGVDLGPVVLNNSASATFGNDGAALASSTGNLTLRLANGTFTGTDINLNSTVSAINGGTARGGTNAVSLSGANVTLSRTLGAFSEVRGDVSAAPGASGSIAVTLADNSTLTLQSLELVQLARGEIGARTARAGDISLGLSGQSSILADFGVFMQSQSLGFLNSFATGGSGQGGAVSITAADSSLGSNGSIIAQSTGVAGGNLGGLATSETGFGGSVSLNVSGLDGSVSAPFVGLAAPGLAFASEGSLGGTAGTGGTVTATVSGGRLLATELSMFANGMGGQGSNIGESSTPTAGGIGRGGTVGLTVAAGLIDAELVTLEANGEGGFGADSFNPITPAGRGGDAFGGIIAVNLTGGSLNTDALSLSAGANVPDVAVINVGGGEEGGGEEFFVTTLFGGGGYAFGDGGAAGAGGNATGGTAIVTIDGGTLAGLGSSSGSPRVTQGVTVTSSGFGGNGGATGGGNAGTKGDGGNGTGGIAIIEVFSGTAEVLNIAVNAAGIGGIAGFFEGRFEARVPAPTGTTVGADGGDGRGGTARVTIASDLGAFTAFGDRREVLLDATGQGGSGADGDVAGNGGNGFGGAATLEIVGADVALIDPMLDASGIGASGGRPGLSNPGGDGGAGFGGSVTLSLSNDASFALTGGLLIAQGVGLIGQDGSNGGGIGAPGDGGRGGDARGGTASLLVSGGSTLSFSEGGVGRGRFDVGGNAGSGGAGGMGFDQSGTSYGNGGDGGSGMGGGIVIEAIDTELDLGDGFFDVSGFGGDGGGRITDESGVANEFSAGGDGGEGFGGSVRLSVIGEGALMSFSSLDINATGGGGSGADGQGVDQATFAGAPGGGASGGTGGTILIEALGGGALKVERSDSGTIPGRISLQADGFSGIGGRGANGGTNQVTGAGGAGGNGGNSGQGTGGNISLIANGGTISGGPVLAIANGEGRVEAFGGSGGTGIVPPGSPTPVPPAPPTPRAPNGAQGLFGSSGGGIGGTVQVSALTDETGLVGGLSVGNTTIEASGTERFFDFTFPSVGGTVSISDRVDDSNGGVRFGSLVIEATGSVSFLPTSVTIESSDSPILVDSDVLITAAGDVAIRTFGTGGVTAGGFVSIDAQGTVQIDDDFCIEAECPTQPTIAAGDFLSLRASGGNVLLGGATTLTSESAILIDAGGSITGGQGSGYRTPGTLSLSAGGDIAVRNAAVGAIDASAGRFLEFIPESETVVERFRARDLTLGEDGGGGRIVVDGTLTAFVGGDATIASGSLITAGQGLSIVAGDDIVIGSGASVAANLDRSSEPGSLLLDAGGLTTNDIPAAGNVASLIVGIGSALDSGNGAMSLVGGAIDARGATLSGADVFADVRNPPEVGELQLDDNGQLAAPCLEGDICFGTVTATGRVQIGLGDAPPIRFLGTGDITADTVSIRTRETLSFGSIETPVAINAGGAVVVESVAGDVELLGGGSLAGSIVDVSAGGSLIGNGALISAGDVGLTVGNSVFASAIIAGGELTAFNQTGGEREGSFSVPGSFVVGQLQLGSDAVISARADILVGDASLGGGSVDFDAGGLVSLGSTTQVGDISLTGDTAAFGALVAGGNIAINAVNGVSGNSALASGAVTIDGSSIDATSLRSGSAMVLSSSGGTALGSAISGAELTIDAGGLSFGSLSSVDTTRINAGSVLGGNADAGSDLEISASGSIALRDASAGSTLRLNGGGISASSLSSGGDTVLDGGSIDVGSIDSRSGIDISAGSVVLRSTRSTGLTSIEAGTLNLSSANAGGGLDLNVDGTATIGTATSGAQLSVVSGDLSFDSLTSAGATTIDASSVVGGDIDAGQSLDVTAASVALGDAEAGTTLTIRSGSIAADRLSSGGDTRLSGGSVDVGTIDSGGAIVVGASQVNLGSTSSNAQTSIDAGTLTLSSANAGGGLDLTVDGTATIGTANSGSAISIRAADLSFDRLTSAGSTTIVGANASGGDIAAGGSLTVTATDAVDLGSAAAGTTLTFNASTIAADALKSGGDTTLTAGSVSVTNSDSGAGLLVTASGDVSLGTTSSLGLTKVGAGSLNLESADADGGLELTVAGIATLGTVQSGAGVTATAAELRFAAITAAAGIDVTADTIGGGDATSTAGAVSLTSTGSTTVGQLRAGTDVAVTAATLTFAGIDASRDVTLDLGSLSGTAIAAGRDLTITSSSGLTFSTIGAGRNVSLTSTNGALIVSTDLNAGGTATLAADDIAVRAVGALRVNGATADSGNIVVTTDGLLHVDRANALGDITLTSTANSLIVGGAVAGDEPNDMLALVADTTPGSTQAGAGAITLAAANDITLLSTIDANTALAATAGRSIDQRGLAVGKTVAYRSADIALGQGSSLGQSNFTTGIVLTNTGTSGAILGDMAGTTAGYRIDAAEFGRIHSGGDLSLAGGSSLTVGTLAASAASGTGGVANGNIGSTGALALSTTGELAIGGALSLANAGGNTVRLTSTGALFVDAGSGSVRLIEGTGRGGTLDVSADSVMAMTGAARTAIAGLDTRAIDQRLALNDGVAAGRTVIEGGAVTISSSGAILIQNTAPGIGFDERRGFAVDSLTLVTRGVATSPGTTPGNTTGLPDIVINGTVGLSTGLNALRAVEIDGAFSDFSTINGCRIVTTSCGSPAINPIRDLIENEVSLDSTLDILGDGFGRNALITIDRIGPVGFETVIDEPVTGAGNDDLLAPEAGAGDVLCTEDDTTKCEKPPVG